MAKHPKMTNTPSTPDEAKPRAAAAKGPVLVDYRGIVSQRVDGMKPAPHLSKWCCQMSKAGAEALVVDPGLNLVEDGLWSSYADHPPVAKGMGGNEDGDGKIFFVLDGLPASTVEMVALIERTRNPEALAFIRAGEKSREKPRANVLRTLDEQADKAPPRPLNLDTYRAPAPSMS